MANKELKTVRTLLILFNTNDSMDINSNNKSIL